MAHYLMDTHVYIWADKTPDKLSERIKAALADPTHDVYLSVASLWEMQIKLQLNTPLQQAVERIKQQGLYQILPIKDSHLWMLEQLPLHHKDPFDRLLICQAIDERLTLMTTDEHIVKYDVTYLN